MTPVIFDKTSCELGEGPLWHPKRAELFWFDIVGNKLFSRKNNETRTWVFDEHVSAAGWVDEDHLLIASQSALVKFQISSGKSETVCALEKDNPITRSNDGRTDPWGGLWIGTMGLGAEKEAGAIYRYYRGEVRVLFPSLSIPNAICFSPDRDWGYFADTMQSKIWRQKLAQKDGWPQGEPEIFIDFSGTGLNPDGAVCDVEGNLWNAQWGAARVAQYSSEGVFLSEVKLSTDHITCPAFGGADMRSLYITSARESLSSEQLAAQPAAGNVFVLQSDFVGQKEHQVIL